MLVNNMPGTDSAQEPIWLCTRNGLPTADTDAGMTIATRKV